MESLNPFRPCADSWVHGIEAQLRSSDTIQQKIVCAQLFCKMIREIEQKQPTKPFAPTALKGKSGGTAEKTMGLFGKKITCKTDQLQRNIEDLSGYLNLQYGRLIPGVKAGLVVQNLRKELASPFVKPAERATICDQIAKAFEQCPDYRTMCDLRDTIEGDVIGTSPLFSLVYTEVDVPTCHRILKAINGNFEKSVEKTPDQIRWGYMVYSDVDDTIKPSLNDLEVDIHSLYPSCIEFFRQLGNASPKAASGVSLSFLSARPKIGASAWNNKLSGILPKGTKFYGLYGSVPAMTTAMKFYLVKFFVALARRVLTGGLLQHVLDFCRRLEVDAYLGFAIDKRLNMDRDLLLRPERRGIMIGDTGEADLLCLLAKNTGVPSPYEDERIPEEYRPKEKWEETDSPVGNPSNRPLAVGFAHAISSRTRYSGAAPEPKPEWRLAYEKELKSYVFDNYVDNAWFCLHNGILDKNAADRIVQDSREWIGKHQKEICSMLNKHGIECQGPFSVGIAELDKLLEKSTLKPNVLYRMKLLRSVLRYDPNRGMP